MVVLKSWFHFILSKFNYLDAALIRNVSSPRFFDLPASRIYAQKDEACYEICYRNDEAQLIYTYGDSFKSSNFCTAELYRKHREISLKYTTFLAASIITLPFLITRYRTWAPVVYIIVGEKYRVLIKEDFRAENQDKHNSQTDIYQAISTCDIC